MKYLIPRFLLIALILVAAGAARNWIAQFVVLATVKSKTGLEFSVQSTSFEPLAGSLQMEGIKISPPPQLGKEFITIDSFNAVLNTGDLLKKLYRLETVEIHGIRYKADLAEESNWFVPKEMWDRFKTRFPDWFASNLDHDWSMLLSGKLDEETLALLKQQFESANYASEMSKKWNKELAPLFQKTQTIQERVQRIRTAVQSANQRGGANPLESLAAVLQDAGSLELDFRNIMSEAQTLQNMAKNEAASLKQFLRDDFEKIRNLKPPKIDQQFVSDILIGPELNERLATILAWIESANTMMNEPAESGRSSWFDVNRLPGTEVVFESRKNITEYCIQRVEFDGDLTFEDQPIYFVGRVFDLASPAANWDQVTMVQLCLDTAPMSHEKDVLFASPPFDTSAFAAMLEVVFKQPIGANQALPIAHNENVTPRIHITAILDQRSDVPRERYLIACPNMELPNRVLGREDTLAFAVSPGVSRFYAVIDRVGENLDGRIRLTQTHVHMTPSLPPKMRGSELDTVLASLAQGINQIDAELTVSGTIENPQIRINSDLGERFATSLQPILLGQWNESRQFLADELSGQTNDVLQQVGGLFSEQLDPLLNQLNLAQSQITGGNPNTSAQQVIQSLMSGDSKAAKQQLQQQGTQILNNALQNVLQRAK